MYVLLLMFLIDGQLQVEELEQPDYATCKQERDLWLRHVNRVHMQEPEAFCVVRGRK